MTINQIQDEIINEMSEIDVYKARIMGILCLLIASLCSQ